jgi:signal transduction histidine kinase
VSPKRWVSPATKLGRARGGIAATYRADDPGLVRAFAVLRVLVGLTICISALFVTAKAPDTRLWLFIVSALWLPLSVVLLVSTLRTRSRTVIVIGAISDLVMLATAQALLHQGIGLTSCYPIIAAFAAYTCPGVSIWVVGGFTLALSLSVQSQLAAAERFTAGRFGLFAALVVGVLLIVERATSRSRGAEQRFVQAKTRADVVLDAVGSAVVVTDSASRVITANPAADQALGSDQALTGRLCGDALRLHIGERRLDCREGCQLLALRGRHLPDESTVSTADEAGSGAGDGHEVHDLEAWRPARGGGRQPLLVSVNPLPAAAGPGVEVVHSIRDISRLKQADEAKTLFLATASHELKTPLTVINGFAKTLTTRTLEPEKQREALASIRRRGEELARVVDRLLLSSRIEAGRAEVARTVVDLIPLVYERAAELGEATDRQFEVDLPDDLPTVFGDPSAVTTVIDHLLDNAVKYSPGGGPVRVGAHREGVVAVVLDVTDAGVGMDSETVRHCFEKFWQADASGTRRFGGTGIGLYIVRSLTEAMGGSVAVRSELGAGTTFSLRLLAADAGPVIPAPTAAEAGPAQLRRRGRLPRVSRGAETPPEAISRD